MASPSHPRDQNNCSSLAKDIEHTKMLIMELLRKVEYKDNLLAAALEQIRGDILEKAKLKTSEAQLKARLRDLETQIEDLKDNNQTLIEKERICNVEQQALIEKERICNVELQAARKTISEFGSMLTHHRNSLGIKPRGEVKVEGIEKAN